MQSFRIITPQVGEPFTIGRKPDNSLVLDNPMVSRYHAVIENAGHEWILKNLTQNSVTQVNGTDVDQKTIDDGDTILIGPLQLRATLKRGHLQLLLMESVERDLVQTISLSNSWNALDSLHMDIPEGTSARIHANGAEISFKDKIVNTQGQHRVEGLKGTTVQEMKGIELKGQSGAQARCIYDGEVSGVAGYGGSMIVIVRHGTYFSVYSDLSSVKVTRGQKVSARQIIGSVSREGTMKFQLRRISGALLNPLSWLSR